MDAFWDMLPPITRISPEYNSDLSAPHQDSPYISDEASQHTYLILCLFERVLRLETAVKYAIERQGIAVEVSGLIE